MKVWVACAIGLVPVPTAGCGQPDAAQSSIAESSIRADQIAIYEAALGYWLGKKQDHQLVSEQLTAAPSEKDDEFKECTQGLKFATGTHVTGGMKSLSGVDFKRHGIELTDGSKWTPADPETGIATGKSIKSAVAEAFSKSLVSLSVITFSSDGNDALVKIALVCGGLCGGGATLHLHKTGTQWVVLNRCGEWIS